MRLFCLFYSLYPSTFSCFFFFFLLLTFCVQKKSYLSWVLVDCSRTANSIYLSLIVSLSHRFLSSFASPLLVRALLLFYYLFWFHIILKKKNRTSSTKQTKKKPCEYWLLPPPERKSYMQVLLSFSLLRLLSFCEKTKNIHLFPTIKKKKVSEFPPLKKKKKTSLPHRGYLIPTLFFHFFSCSRFVIFRVRKKGARHALMDDE